MKTRSNLYKVLTASLLIGAVVFNLSAGSAVKRFFEPKIARAADDITCDCALLGGNQNCAANNYGAQCAPDGTTSCSNYSNNCEG